MFWKGKETDRIIALTNDKKTGLEKFKAMIPLIYKQDPYLDFVFYLKRKFPRYLDKKTFFMI